jgi:hypothetical protein
VWLLSSERKNKILRRKKEGRREGRKEGLRERKREGKK